MCTNTSISWLSLPTSPLIICMCLRDAGNCLLGCFTHSQTFGLVYPRNRSKILGLWVQGSFQMRNSPVLLHIRSLSTPRCLRWQPMLSAVPSREKRTSEPKWCPECNWFYPHWQETELGIYFMHVWGLRRPCNNIMITTMTITTASSSPSPEESEKEWGRPPKIISMSFAIDYLTNLLPVQTCALMTHVHSHCLLKHIFTYPGLYQHSPTQEELKQLVYHRFSRDPRNIHPCQDKESL